MARLSRLELDVVDAQTAAVYEHLQHTRGNVPRMFKTMAHRPAILQTAVAHWRAILETGTIPLKLKQLLIVRTSELNRCEYCANGNLPLAKQLGWSDAQLRELNEPGESFTAAERIALEFADVMTLDSHGVTDELFAELRRHFGEGEIVELAAVVGLYNYFTRFNEALQMESQ